MRLFITLLALIMVHCTQGQINDTSYDVYQITKGYEVIKSTCITPDGSELVVSTFRGKLIFFDSESFVENRFFDIAGFPNGGRISFSEDGSCVLLKQIRANDGNLNKDNTQRVVVVDMKTGKVLISHERVFDLALAPDLNTYAIMEKGSLEVRSFPDGKKLHFIQDERLGSSIAYGPKSEIIYSSRGFNKSDLKKDARFKKDRKGRKAYSKFQQTIVGYAVDGLEQKFISKENMDEIYDIRGSQKQDRLLIYAKQDEKVNSVLSTNFILQMDIATGHLLREQFNSKLPDPDFKENLKGNLMGVSTTEDLDRSQSVILYDMDTNEIVSRFDVDARFLESLKMRSNLDGGASLDFSPDGKYLFTCIGNNLYQWEIKREEQ